jgi:AraC-like DNA-binding protein
MQMRNDGVTCTFINGIQEVLALDIGNDTMVLPLTSTALSAFPGISRSHVGLGNLLFVPSHTCRTVTFHEAFSAVVLSIGDDLRRRIRLVSQSARNSLPDCARLIGSRAPIVAMLQMIRRLAAVGEITNPACLLSVAQLLLHETLVTWDQPLARDAPRVRSLDPRIVAKVDRYIERNMEEHVDLETMARLAGMSRYHFLRTFKQATGMSPLQYVIAKRIDRAQKMLRESNEPIAEVAYAVGFSSQSHLTSAFRRQLGTTPGAFRRKSHPASPVPPLAAPHLAQSA